MTRTQQLIDAGLLERRPDPFSTDEADTVIICKCCKEVEGHAPTCPVLARLTKVGP